MDDFSENYTILTKNITIQRIQKTSYLVGIFVIFFLNNNYDILIMLFVLSVTCISQEVQKVKKVKKKKKGNSC